MAKLMSVNGDNLTVAGLIPEETVDIVPFDPIFRSEFNSRDSKDYNDFLARRLDIAVPTMVPNGKIVYVNYNNEQFFVKTHLKQYGITPDWDFKVPRNGRGNSLSDPYLVVTCFSREDGPKQSLSIGDVLHRPGVGNVREAMPMREVDGILHFLNADRSNIIFDMFGGSGQFAQAAHGYGAHCITVELLFQRYNDINNRLNTFVYSGDNDSTCKLKVCRRRRQSRGLCACHAGQLRTYRDRSVYIGEQEDGSIVATQSYTPTSAWISEAKLAAHKAELENNLSERLEKLKEFEEKLSFYNSSFQTYDEF